MTKESIKSKVRAFLAEEQNIAPESITDVAHLLDEGVIDSVILVKMVTYLESAFSITLDPEDITTENLESIEHISHLVLSKAEG